MSAFTGDALFCLRGERIVFTELDFQLQSGDALILSGANGSGKSSLLRMMAGLLLPAVGTISWDGESISSDREAHGARLHYLGHLDGVKADLSVAENLRFAAVLRGAAANSSLGEALAHFALEDLAERPVRLLSQGQRRRLALSRLLAATAPLWLLDEPSVGLDAKSVESLVDAIERHRRAGGIVVMATHQALPLPATEMLDLDRFAPDEESLRAAAAENVW
jgi:heme exporter protein A